MQSYLVKKKLLHRGRTYLKGFKVILDKEQAVKYYNRGYINKPDFYDEYSNSKVGPDETQEKKEVEETKETEKVVDDNYTVRELKQICQDENIKGYSTLNKTELIDLINRKLGD